MHFFTSRQTAFIGINPESDIPMLLKADFRADGIGAPSRPAFPMTAARKQDTKGIDFLI